MTHFLEILASCQKHRLGGSHNDDETQRKLNNGSAEWRYPVFRMEAQHSRRVMYG
jgi:hypothetical protein